MKFKSFLLASVLATTLLTGCGRDIEGLTPDMNSVGILSTEPSNREMDALNSVNRAIDFATGSKNTQNNSNVKFYIDGPEAYPALESLLEGAKESFLLEVFIFTNDYTGRKFADALVRKAKQGVEVKVLYDFFGNSNVKLMNYMAQNGVHVETYNKQVLTSKGINITHRKVFIADGERAMTGGMNIGDEYATGQWHDTMMSYEGEAVKETLKEYIYDWKSASGKPSPKMTSYLTKEFPKTENKQYPLRVTVTSPKEVNKKEDIQRTMFAAIDAAKDNVKISMPYLSDDNLVKHLSIAAKRGVKVTALIPEENDQKAFVVLNQISVNDLIKAGATVYRGSYNHSKVISVDNVWTTIGSCNGDYRALHINQELNVSISDPEFTADFNRRFFEHHISNSKQGLVKKIAWYKKPLYSFLEALDKYL